MPAPKKQSKPAQDTPDYERLGRMLASIYEYGYVSKRRLFGLNLLRGVAMGLGSVIGATIIVALLLWILSFFDFVPLIGPLQEVLQETVESEPL